MATMTEVDELRLATNIISTDAPYTDEYMLAVIDAAGSVNGAAARIWRQKAAQYAEAVDMSESGSSRKMSQLSAQALTMASHYDELAAGETINNRPFTVQGVRL